MGHYKLMKLRTGQCFMGLFTCPVIQNEQSTLWTMCINSVGKIMFLKFNTGR